MSATSPSRMIALAVSSSCALAPGGAVRWASATVSLCVLARRHADRAVEADILTVPVVVLDHRQRQLGIFLGPAEPLGKRHRGGERFLRLFRQRLHQGSLENTGQDG